MPAGADSAFAAKMQELLVQLPLSRRCEMVRRHSPDAVAVADAAAFTLMLLPLLLHLLLLMTLLP